VKDPATGRRVSRINPRETWITKAVSELRIVDDALWQAVKGRQAMRTARASAPVEPRGTNRVQPPAGTR
jgi:site-specific DNA recombinase